MIIQALSSSFSRPLYRGLDPIFGEMVGFQTYNDPYSPLPPMVMLTISETMGMHNPRILRNPTYPQIQINKFLQSTNIAKSRWARTTTRARGQPGTCTPWSSVLLAAIRLSLRWLVFVFIFALVFVLCITNKYQFVPFIWKNWSKSPQGCYSNVSQVTKACLSWKNVCVL